jgi:4-hydroxy 2-oxovalerate aldolase
VSVNFAYDKGKEKYAFFGNPRRYKQQFGRIAGERVIISSNVYTLHGNEMVVNYSTLVDRGFKYFDNSTVMLLHLLRNIGVENIYIAGLDGLERGKADHYFQSDYNTGVEETEYDLINSDLKEMLRNYSKTLQNKQSVKFITPSKYESIFS